MIRGAKVACTRSGTGLSTCPVCLLFTDGSGTVCLRPVSLSSRKFGCSLFDTFCLAARQKNVVRLHDHDRILRSVISAIFQIV